MCGFVGIYNVDGRRVDEGVINKMTEVQAHRGPDDRGLRYFSIKKGISREEKTNESCMEGAVGFNRLSIVDLSSRGHQPMSIHKGRVILVFNGEIYNAFNYRRELSRQGVKFHSNTDTEVIIRLYEKYGFDKLLPKLNGMFALSIIDLEKGRIYLARDRLGIKPLYYYYKDGLLMFSSEIKSFLFHPRFSSKLNIDDLDEYLLFRYIAGNRTLLKDVCRVCPGEYLSFYNNNIKRKAYWSLKAEPGKYADLSFAEASEKIIAKLNKSIEMRLMSDADLGISLSGGIDSSLVAVEAARQKENMEAYSIIFNNQQYSEEKWVDQVTDKVNINTNKLIIEPGYFTDNFARATWHLDKPLTNAASLAYLYLTEQAYPRVKVLLTGEGSDEVFAGYRRYPKTIFLNKYSALNKILSRLPLIKDSFLRSFNKFNNKYVDKHTRFILETSALSFDYLQNVKPDAAQSVNRLIKKRKSLFPEQGANFISDCLLYDLKTYLPTILNHKDKMGMANSIESRVPFLDHELIEMVKGLPLDYLIRPAVKERVYRNSKLILKKYAASLFNDEFAYRHKFGFLIPLEEFIFTDRFREYVEELILPGIKKRGIFNYQYIILLWKQLTAEKSSSALKLWNVLAFECWAQLFLDGKPGLHLKGVG